MRRIVIRAMIVIVAAITLLVLMGLVATPWVGFIVKKRVLLPDECRENSVFVSVILPAKPNEAASVVVSVRKDPNFSEFTAMEFVVWDKPVDAVVAMNHRTADHMVRTENTTNRECRFAVAENELRRSLLIIYFRGKSRFFGSKATWYYVPVASFVGAKP